jgi:flagellar assembly protein FliH
MSLYNKPETTIDNGKLWKRFHPESFNSQSKTREKKEHPFVSLKPEDLEKANFVPYEERGEKYKKTQMSKDLLHKAEDTLKASQDKASMIEQEAYEKGFAQGEVDGLEFGKKEAVKVVENIETLLKGCEGIKREIIKGYEKEILELIFIITEKVINYKIRSDEEIVKKTVLKALQLAPEKGDITIRVNSEDFDYIENIKQGFAAKFRELHSIKLVSDLSIERGGCLLETQYGDIDARIGTQLEKIFQSLKDVYNNKEYG